MRRKKEEEKTTLSEAIKMVGLNDDDKIFIHVHNKIGDTCCTEVKNIDKKTLKKPVRLIQGHYGGKEHKYNSYLFILEREGY